MAALIAWVIIGILALIVLYIVITFNSLIMLKNRVNNAWSQIDVQLKRRYDLIPNLINSVKGYMKHERGVLTEVTKMRSSLISGSMSQKAKASDAITNALKTIFAVSENYPKLRQVRISRCCRKNWQELKAKLHLQGNSTTTM